MVDRGREELIVDLAIESLRKSGTLRFRAQGTSMLPTIRPGSSVIVRRVEPDDIRAGDVVLTSTHAGLRLHRLVAETPQFVTRGDNHAHIDPPVSPEQVLGKLFRVESAGGRILRIFRRICA